MTATEHFIKDAIDGGWNDLMKGVPFEVRGDSIITQTDKGNESLFETVSCMLLDPLAWQAVGKTRGWSVYPVCSIHGADCLLDCSHGVKTEHEYKWHRFIDHLNDGKTVEEALLALE